MFCLFIVHYSVIRENQQFKKKAHQVYSSMFVLTLPCVNTLL